MSYYLLMTFSTALCWVVGFFSGVPYLAWVVFCFQLTVIAAYLQGNDG